jgi:uncharacterized membrane protein
VIGHEYGITPTNYNAGDQEMSLTPILDAPLMIQLHIVAATPAVLIGPLVLFRRSRDRVHKYLGYVWVIAMACLAIFGLFIPSVTGVFSHFGPLHGFNILTLWSLWRGITFARQGNYAGHAATFQGLWYGGIGGAGLANFLPGRTMNQVVFNGPSDAGYIVIGVGALALFALWLRTKPKGMQVA